MLHPFQKIRSFLSVAYITAVVVFFLLVGRNVIASSESDVIVSSVKKLSADNSISLVILYPEGSLASIQRVADEFTALTGIRIIFEQATVDNINTAMLLGALQDNAKYDVALPATFGIPDLVEAGALYDLTEYAARYEPRIRYTPSLYDLGDRYKGRKYGYQTDGDTYVMFYHQEWLENQQYQTEYQAQYNTPLAVPTTWQELDRMIAFFHRPNQDMYGSCMFRTPRYTVWEWWVRFHAKGALPFNQKMQPQIAGEAGIQALDDMIAVSEFHHPSVTSNGLFENWEQYAKGHCFANIGWGGSQKYFNSSKSSLRGKMVHSPTPGVSYFNWGWNYVVAQGSQHSELAYLFTLFATTSDIATLAVREDGFFDPYRVEHYEDPDIQKVYTESFLQAHKQTMEQAIPDFYLEGHGLYVQALEDAILSAAQGHATAREALEYAEREWQKITLDIGRESQLEQWLELKSKYPKAQ